MNGNTNYDGLRKKKKVEEEEKNNRTTIETENNIRISHRSGTIYNK